MRQLFCFSRIAPDSKLMREEGSKCATFAQNHIWSLDTLPSTFISQPSHLAVAPIVSAGKFSHLGNYCPD